MNSLTILGLIILVPIFVYICALATALLRLLWRKGDKK